MYEAIAGMIKEVGFPIGVAVYLLVVFRKSIAENTKATIENAKAIIELTRYIKNHNDKVEKP